MKVPGTLITNYALRLMSQRNESQRLESRTLHSVEVAFCFSEKVVFRDSETQVSDTQDSETHVSETQVSETQVSETQVSETLLSFN